MRIYVSGIIQYSVFSSGYAILTLQIAEALKQLGHDVHILNILDTNTKWFDDVHSISSSFPVLQKSDFCGPNASVDCIGGVIKADILIDVIGCISGEDRAKIAGRTIMFMGKPPIHNEMESIVYLQGGFRRCYEGLSEIWTWDFYNQNDFVFLSLIGRCRIRPMPFVWSPAILQAYLSEMKIPPWHVVADSPSGQVADWIVRIAETNSSSRSSCTLPLVTMAEFTRKYPNTIRQVYIHNAEQLRDRAFFMNNVYANCKGSADEPKLVGRMRCVEWCMQPRSILLAHCRFVPFRYLYLDAAWLGIPMIHNSPLMRKLGGPLERYYYDDNSVSDSAAAIKRFIDNYKSGDHNERELAGIRESIIRSFSVHRDGVQKLWNTALNDVASGPVVPLVARTTATPTFVVQFVGMWDQFQANYNFFTLLLENYFRKCGQMVNVIGVDESYSKEPIHVRIMGPFGQKQPVLAGIPAIFTTSENIPALPADVCEKNMIRVQLGFSRRAHNGKSYIRLPLWMMSMDWFNVDNDRIVNPKLIPIEWLTESQCDKERSKFCSFVVTNPNNSKRNAALDLIGRVGHVDSAGRYRNNYGGDIFAGLGGGGGELKKVEFFRNYRFAITYENSYGEGYVTEKLFHAKAAGCIPIYWGDNEAAEEDFVAGGWINAGALSDEELVNRVRWLESAEGAAERNRIAATPLLNQEKLECAVRRLDEVATAIINASLFNGIKTPLQEISRNEHSAPVPAPASYGRIY